jgi:hypothetical protein
MVEIFSRSSPARRYGAGELVTVPLLPTEFVAQYQDLLHCEAGMSGFGLTAGVRAASGRMSTGCARATGT